MSQKIRVKVENITVGYGFEIVLRNLSFEYEGPGLIQVLGPNGAGKSTLLKTITGLLKPLKGRVLVNDEDVTGKPEIAGKYIGYVPQLSLSGELSYPITLYELVACCYVLGKPWPRIRLSSEERKHVEKILESLGLTRDKWFKKFDELSGGEKQRGLIARALVRNPPILLMDEPFSNIDPEGRMEIAKKIAELRKDKLLIITSHDPTILMPYTDKILLINRNIYFYGNPREVLKREVIEKIYGKAFIVHGKHVHIIDSHI